MNKYYKVWKQLGAMAIGSYLSNRLDSISYFIGKVIRFAFFFLFIITIFKFTDSLAGYTKYEVILFFITFYLVDTLPQALFRGIYLFRDDVRNGNFDYVLSKPVNPLFYSLTRLFDILDIIFLIPIIVILVYTISKLAISISLLNILLYIFFIIIGQIIFIGIQISTACVTLRTMESENLIWFYRHSFVIGKYPPEIFSYGLRIFYTFVVPVMIIVSFPAKALLGKLSFMWGAIAVIYTFVFLFLIYLFWLHSLKHYSSASS